MTQVSIFEEKAGEMKAMHTFLEQAMSYPYYAKMGESNIRTLLYTASRLGLDPIDALNGGLYCIRDKVEMPARTMAMLILKHKHSFEVVKSDSTVCIIRGVRADTGAKGEASFTIQEAHQAKLTNNPTWSSYPADMLYARALTRLARRLFADVIGGCYVDGEIDIEREVLPVEVKKEKEIEEVELESIHPEILDLEKRKNLAFLLDQVPEYRDLVQKYLAKEGAYSLDNLPVEHYQKICEKATLLILSKEPEIEDE